VDSLESKWASVRLASVAPRDQVSKKYPQQLTLESAGRYGVVLDAGSSVRQS
jgi:hypothetical protein